MARKIAVRGPQRNWLKALHDQIERAVTRRLTRRGAGPAAEPPRTRDAWSSLFEPPGFGPLVDVIDEDDALRVVAELPGLSPEDFRVEAEGRRVHLSGERKSHHQERRRDHTYTECNYGSFSRVIPLPCEVLPDKAEASYRDGLLQLRLPKTETAKARRVRVKVH